jgi:hypothetical protein
MLKLRGCPWGAGWGFWTLLLDAVLPKARMEARATVPEGTWIFQSIH